jgi:hypothetical protein
MNERIEKLAEQCRIETYGVNGELLEFGFDEEKFAQLIVRDVLDEVLQAMDDGMDVYDTVAGKFGVEQ